MDKFLVTISTADGTRRYFFKVNEVETAKRMARKERGILYDLSLRMRIA